jgi:uncharacterized protein YciI
MVRFVAVALLWLAAAAVPQARPAAGSGGDSTRVATLADSLYLVLLETGPAYRVGVMLRQQPGGPDHAAYMRSLTASGRSLLGGPYGADPHRMVLSGAILVLRAGSLEEARGMVAADPGIASGLLRLAGIGRWMPATGALAAHLRRPAGAR